MKYNYKKARKTSINVRKARYEGETIEEKVDRVTTQKEPIKDGAPEIFTERKEGVGPAFNIRTDRFELATEAMDYVTRSSLAKREERHNPKVIDINDGKEEDNGKAEPSQQ